MKKIQVKTLLVPPSEFATVYEDDTLYDAVAALREAGKIADEQCGGHRSVLVRSRDGRIVGHLTQWDICRGLEPKYRHIGDLRQTSRYGFSPDFIKSMLDAYGLWRKPLEDICKRAFDIKIREIMLAPGEGEFVDENASLDEAIHQLVMGRHQCLLVTSGDNIVGLLRLSDVFNEIGKGIGDCAVQKSN